MEWRWMVIKETLFEKMYQSILKGEKEEAASLARISIEKQIPPLEAIHHGFVRGMEEVGTRFESEEMYLPELVMAAEAMISAMGILEGEIKKGAERPKLIGRAIAGTVYGDIHDIGKNIVCTLFTVHGFEVLDLGPGVPTDLFVQKVTEEKPDFLLLSALLTTTMPGQREVIEALKKAGLRNNVNILVGGAPVSQKWADEIGADGFGRNAIEAVSIARELVG
jgi:corrinoid protein of di/trimethylamine methyltransferase